MNISQYNRDRTRLTPRFLPLTLT